MASKKLAKAEAKLRQQAQKHWKKATKAFNTAQRKVKSYVKTHPKRAAAIAAGVMLARRKKRR